MAVDLVAAAPDFFPVDVEIDGSIKDRIIQGDKATVDAGIDSNSAAGIVPAIVSDENQLARPGDADPNPTIFDLVPGNAQRSACRNSNPLFAHGTNPIIRDFEPTATLSFEQKAG